MVRKSSKLVFRAGVFIAVLLACITGTKAQTWTQIGNLPPWVDMRCAYFWSPNEGVVAGVGHIYTYNGGVWKEAAYPEGFDTIKSLRLLDGFRLYAASGSTCIWTSDDRGATWQKTSYLYPNADDVFLGENGIAAVNYAGNGMRRGTTIVNVNPKNSPPIFVIAKDDDDSIIFTNPKIRTEWDTVGTFDCGYSCVSDTCSQTCYIISDSVDAVLYRSTNYGGSWEPEYDFGPFNAIDVMDGADWGVMYVQGTHNVFRSISGGVSWENIGGPRSKLDDRRMFTFGQYNRYLVVMDSFKVYLWDGGTGYIPTGPMTKVLTATNVVDTNCTFPQLTVNLNMQDYPDTVRIHAYTLDSSTIQPSDTTIILPAGTGTMPVKFQTSVSPYQFTTAFYFNDTITGIYECGQFRYAENASMSVQLPSYPKNILSVSNVTDTACSLSNLTIYLAKTTNPDTVRIHAYTNDGLLIQPTDTMLIVPTGSGMFPVQYRASAHPFQFASTFHFIDTVSGEYKCSKYKYVTDSSIVVHLFPPPGRAQYWLNTPVKFNACADYRIPLVVRAPNICDSLQIDSITLLNNTLSPQFDHQPPETLGPNGLDTFWVTLSAPTPGIYNNYFFVHANSTVFPRPNDTALFLSSLATASKVNPRATAPAKITVSNCRQSVVPIYLHALLCDSVEFSSCTLTVDKSLNYSTNLNFALDVPAAVSDTLLLTFPPQNLSKTYVIYARLQGNYLGSTVTFDTSVQIQVTFTTSSGALVTNLDEIALDTVSFCGASDFADTIVTYTNLGCDTITVTGDQTSWKAGWSTDDPTFPFSLAPDSSFTVRVQFKPAGAGTSYQSVIYGFENAGGASSRSSALTISAIAIPATSSFSVSSSALNFGKFSLCNTVAVADTSITITNTGCDSLALNSASVDAGNGFTLASGADTILGRNESARYTIHFSDSVAGALGSIFHIHCVGTHGGNAIDTTVSLTATIVAGASMASISTTAIDFGTTSICEERDSSVIITNKGCDTLSITSGDFSSLQFVFADTVHFPILIPPNSAATFPIFTHLDTIGHPSTITSTLNFASNSGAAIPSVTLLRSVTYPGKFSLALAAEASAPISASVPIYVTKKGSVPGQANEVDFDLIYNDDILGYRNSLESDIKVTGQTKLANGMLDRSFKMSPASDRDTIATLQFLSYLSKNDGTTLSLTHQQFIVSGAVSPPCVAEMDTTSTPSDFQLDLVCGDSLILAALNDEPPFTIVSIQPNPASTSIEVGYRVWGIGYSDLKFELQNILGQTVTQHSASVAAGTQNLDVSSLSSGVYYLRISSNGYVQTKSISIER